MRATLRVLLTCKKQGWSGETAFLESLARGLAERGHEVTVAAPAGSALQQRLESAPLQIENLHLVHEVTAVRPLVSDVRLLRKLLREVDIVHTQASWDTWLVAMARSGGRRPVPMVRTRHNLKPVRRHRLNRWLYQRSITRTVAVSQTVADDIRETRLVEPDRSEVILNGIDLSVFDIKKMKMSAVRAKWRKHMGAPPEAVVVVYCSRIVPRKQPELMMEAARRLRSQGVDAWFGLAGILPAEPEDWNARMRREMEADHPRIQYLGFVKNTPELLAAADVFVLPADQEPFGLATVEAMAMRCPPVCAASGGSGEVIRDGVTGLLFEPGSVKDCAAKIRELVENEPLRRRMARKGYAEVGERFRRERMVQDYLQLYESLRVTRR